MLHKFIEISHMICNSNQVTGLCMKFSTELKWCNYGLTGKSGPKIFLRVLLYLNKCVEGLNEEW